MEKITVNGCHPMVGGNGIHSYTKNSSFQKGYIDAAKLLIQKYINENESILPIIRLTETFHIADLGCSVGPNTFIAMDNIIEAIQLKLQHLDANIYPEFQVHFNDCIGNDFNTLLKSLPPNRKYYASVDVGSFYTRLFPRASIHFVHCSFSLHWLSQAPTGIINKGRIHYADAEEEVIKAYSRQHAVDFATFLNARAQEVVSGGLIALVLIGRPDEVPYSKVIPNKLMDLLGSCLMDLARKELINEEKVDAFNMPTYFPSPHELKQVIKQNGCFSVERMESLPELTSSQFLRNPQNETLTIRAITQELLKEHFGEEILDEVFALYQQKLTDGEIDHNSTSALNLFVLLKRNQDTTVN